MTLFDFSTEHQTKNQPLADRMRPKNLEEFIGQEHLVGQGRLLRRAIVADKLSSSIFYGPPGCGKTSLAYVIAQMTKADFVRMNAVTSGVSELREVLKGANDNLLMFGRATYLLLDECHRWNKAQSDSILPAIEEGLIRFIGSTTENPMIAMTPAIVSRCRLFGFEPLRERDVQKAIQRAIADTSRGLGDLHVRVDPDALRHWVMTSGGDIRMALNALELAALTTPTVGDEIHIDLLIAEESIQKPVIKVDDSLYYDMLSAFCKSMRGSDSDAALLWCARLLYAGCDPRLIARRMIAHASEDVGLANPQAMLLAVAAAQALDLIGMPEARLPLTQAIISICESEKSNSVVMAMNLAREDAQKGQLGAVPEHLRDAHYSGHERVNNTNGYLYPHDYPGHYIKQNYMPEGFHDRVYFNPGTLGDEASINKKKDQHGSK